MKCVGCSKDFEKLPYKSGTQCKLCYLRNYRQQKRNTLNAQTLEWYKVNREARIEKMREYYSANKEKIRAKNKAWYEANKKEHNRKRGAYNLTYQKARCASDPTYKIARNLRVRISHALSGRRKPGSAIKDLGCSLRELKAHLEALFQPGMTWGNYGRWHVDHILPLSSFNLTNPEDFKKACHYTNLQPLWAEENISKSNHLKYSCKYENKA